MVCSLNLLQFQLNKANKKYIKNNLDPPTPVTWNLQPLEGTTGTLISYTFSQPPQPASFHSLFTSEDPPLDPPLEIPFYVTLNNNAYILLFHQQFPPYQSIAFEVNVDVPNSQPKNGHQIFVWVDPNYYALFETLSTVEPSLSEAFGSSDLSHQEETFDPDQFLEDFPQLTPESQDHWTFGLSLMGKPQILRKLVLFSFYLFSCNLPLKLDIVMDNRVKKSLWI